jgi:hypothetical protein
MANRKAGVSLVRDGDPRAMREAGGGGDSRQSNEGKGIASGGRKIYVRHGGGLVRQ